MTYADPNGAAQPTSSQRRMPLADVDSSTVSYVETHGTGTPLGDPIGIEGHAAGVRRIRHTAPRHRAP